MDWTEIAVMTVPYGIYIEDYSSLEEEVLEIAKIDLIDEELLAKNRETARIHIYISPEDNPAEATAFLEERFRAENINFKILTDKCDVEACLDNWKKYFYPIEIGEKLLVRPVWREDYDPKGRTVLHLEPGIAFGTGTHETTRLCLEALEKYVSDGAAVLDVGCGSGILAVASLLLGAKSAIGIDIDELAVKSSIENAERNGVSDRYTAIHGNLADEVTGTYDIITANIVADAIIMLSGDIEKHMHKDTVYIMSGIIDSRLEDVLSALPKTLKIIETRTDKGWYCLVAKLISDAE